MLNDDYYVSALVRILQSRQITNLHKAFTDLYSVIIVSRNIGSLSDTIVYPTGRFRYAEFERRSGFGGVWNAPGGPLPDTIETRYAYWYVSYIGNRFDVRTMSDDLIAMLVHTRDTGETWALTDYLTENGIL